MVMACATHGNSTCPPFCPSEIRPSPDDDVAAVEFTPEELPTGSAFDVGRAQADAHMAECDECQYYAEAARLANKHFAWHRTRNFKS